MAVGPLDCGSRRPLRIVGTRVRVRNGETVGQHLLGRGELTDADGPDVIRVRLREVAVQLGVVLAVVADQDPADVRELLRSRRSAVRLCSCPLRNQPVLVGPQSVSSNGPTGYPCRARKRVSVGAVFHAPVDR